jgi:hypothetical protein
MKRVLIGFAGSVVILLLGAVPARAQASATAQISGIVKDDSGGVLPGVDVAVTRTDTGQKRNAITDADGAYVIPNLAVGPYRLEATLQGFRTYAQTGIVLQVGANPVINIAMAVGAVEETVTVQASALLVETRNLGVGQVMDNKRILDLPLNGRNPADLILSLPAAVPQPALNATSRSMGGSNGGQAYSLAGGLSFGVSFVLDGAMHNNPYDNLNLPLPFPDALGEFKAETSTLTAQNGMHSGGAINYVTKSGSNQFRGDVFEFLRHHSFNSIDPYAAKNPDGSRKDDGLKRNQYGGTFGGPIRRDKLFFFAGYQGTNTRVNPTSNISYVPTAAMMAGDFTAYASPACNAGRQITLPASLGFVGNRIDPGRFSKSAVNISSKLPTTTDPCGQVQYGLPSATDEGQYVGKVDAQLSVRHSAFGRYIATTQFTPPPFSLDAAQQNLLVTRMGGRDNLAQTFTGGENFVISSTTLNQVRFAYNRTDISRTSTDFFSAPEAGINIYSYMPHYMLLTVGPNGFQLGGGTESLSTFTTSAWQISDDVTLVRGPHQFAFGGNVAGWKSLSLANVRSPGQLTIDGTQTGLPLSDFLTGRMGVNALVQAAPNTLDMTETYLGLYAQDTWRVGSRVTVNLGVRYEPYFPQQLQNGAVYQFDQARFNQNIHSVVFPNAPAGLYFPGDAGFPTKAGMKKQWGNVGPRVGIAWDPAADGRTSVRASYGRSFEFVNGQFHLNTSVAPPWGSEVRINSPLGGLDNPFINTSGQKNIFPVTFDQNAPFSLNGPFLSLSNDMAATHVDQWNVTIERQIGSNVIVSAGYLGSRTSNIWESEPLNNAVYQNVGGAPPSTANINARRPFTLQDPVNGQYYGPVDLYVTDGRQNYNGMLLSVRKTGTRTTLAVNYALSHCYGSPDGFGGSTTNVSTGYNKPDDHGYDDGNCTADRRQNFTLTGSAMSPVFDNPTWGAIVSNWQLVASFRAITGPWLTILTGADRLFNGQVATQRVNQVSGDVYGNDAVNPTNGNITYLNSAAFAQPMLGTFGNMSRNLVRGPDYKNLDLALTRAFRLSNSKALEIRIEAFNAFNWFEWGQPNTTFSAPTFGQISSAMPMRVWQFALKYTF